MRFLYSDHMQNSFPGRTTGLIMSQAIGPDATVTDQVADLTKRALARLEAGSEGSFPEIQAWRRAYTTMGLKPTQYRCAAEALLRRLRKDGTLPQLHPLIDLCNAASVAYAMPVAVFDLDQIAGDLEVRQANGDETYLSFSGEGEPPDPGEVIFADDERNAHARRWAHRQSRKSAVSEGTTRALIVAEAQHAGGGEDVKTLCDELSGMVAQTFGAIPKADVLPTPDAVFDSAEIGGRAPCGSSF